MSTTTLADVITYATAKSYRFTMAKDITMRHVILQNCFIKSLNDVLAKNPTWFTVEDIEMIQAAGTPIAKKQMLS